MEKIPGICNSVDLSRDYFAKWNKAATGEQTLHDYKYCGDASVRNM